MWRHLSSLSGKFAYRALFQASSGHSDSANRPGYEAGIPQFVVFLRKLELLFFNPQRGHKFKYESKNEISSGSCVQISSSRKLPNHVVQIHLTGEQVTHWDKTDKELVSPKMVITFVCLVPVRLLLPSPAAKGLSTAHTSYNGGVLLSRY